MSEPFKEAPSDPRSPSQGVPVVTEFLFDPIVRILAPNPSPMTLDGTNTYIWWNRSSAAAVIVDPGPTDARHQANIAREVQRRDLEVTGVVMSHHHVDHSESALQTSREYGVPIYAHPDAFPSMQYLPLVEGARGLIGGVAIEVIETPGHCHDHLAYLGEGGTLLTGDHILGRGTTVVAYPDGNLAEYLESLEKLTRQEYSLVLPGHGPEIDGEVGVEVIEYYLSHRRGRLEQICELLNTRGPLSSQDLTRAIYGDQVSSMVLWAGNATTQAALAYLSNVGRVVLNEDGVASLSR